MSDYPVTSPSDMRIKSNAPAPEPSRTLSLDESARGDTVANYDDLVPGQENVVSSPRPSHPELALELEEAKQQYGRAIDAIGQRDRLLEDLKAQMEEVRLQMELMSSIPPARPPGPVNPNWEEMKLNPTDGVTVSDLYNFAQNFAMQQQMAMDQREVSRIRSSWSITPAQEQEIIQRFPQLANLPELQKVQAIQKVGQTLYRPKSVAASASERPPVAAQPLASQPVPMPETSRPLVRDEKPDTGALTAAWQEYEAAKKVINPRERAQRMRDGAEKISRLQGRSLDDDAGGQWVSRG